ncbi:spore germination protein GerPC [Paenibacillus doosanensis]|uniref:spore germination protein GerPC n=1 Tax=Paenibacillus doosanensis TaxID=1229154 RepID=UPI00217F79B0|nr:spore germination protein GerPC [Paenibacillus doosanensis]MCS7461805.1 spore germination protein GerPC [Paenibacillus doosanensis]
MMNTWYQWTQYVGQLHSQIHKQSLQLAELEKALKSLQAEVASLKDQKQIHIDKIEYKFDQLKVEKLDGTLNIGITPQQIEDLAVDADAAAQKGEEPVKPSSELNSVLQKELGRYLNEEVPNHIEVLQKQLGLELDSWHRQMILQDLGKQTEQRMHFYLQQMEPGATTDQLSSIKDSVLFRTKNDIKKAIDHYFSKLPKKDVNGS